ncbi:UNKNOWN [Stylonychia lemnae]|uniref:SET domain-containing protein n=1 Tax=Stylonychia lemnae TaxID=5949 RepID=A0A078B616_STYLE|nr:UNKNOWN [Stylonychia lemnae]|eukprot:CDW88943.1 UNKNOWN [Stylonychia lemnae]
MKTDNKNKEFMANLKLFNEQIATMISNAGKILKKSDDKKEEAMNYAMVTFLKNYSQGFEVNMDNFKTVIHLYFISICNGFGIADNQMLRIGTGLYSPTNLINHSCEPSAMVIFNGKRQFIVSCRDIEPDEEITISYVDNGIKERLIRSQYLIDQYYFNCSCIRCLKQIQENTDKSELQLSQNLSEDLEQLNLQALQLEQEGQFKVSLDILLSLLETVKQGCYISQIQKEIYERITYLAVQLKDYKTASVFQNQLVDLCEILYLQKDHLPHPLMAMHYYQQGKLMSQRKKYDESVLALQKASSLISDYYGIKSKIDGKMIDEKLVNEVNENLLANIQLQQNKKNKSKDNQL